MAGLTLDDMARAMGMSRSTYHATELGRRPLSLVEQEHLLRQAAQLIEPASTPRAVYGSGESVG
jgi:transcriptional regulator with XRE-family HTH domain